ncbi:hypothetical protein V6N12_045326 [Hibiscus sabdariffa]|uniref:Uncharacterized protein n=1 Tax=Hibiscus sabdariffa TaxID=183260 RepID=A0ABR2G2F3_9ROSI
MKPTFIEWAHKFSKKLSMDVGNGSVSQGSSSMHAGQGQELGKAAVTMDIQVGSGLSVGHGEDTCEASNGIIEL